MPRNALYAQSGGVTAVINASACGVLEEARLHPDTIGKVYAGRNGILGILEEDLIDTSLESREMIAALRHTPGGAFGSCRYQLKAFKSHRTEYERLIQVFKAHDIGYFFYNGGGDSQDTAHKIAEMSQIMNYPLICIGIPKTIDNDLPFTDNCPGFGSVAKYVALSTLEAGLDIASMARTSTKVFILEVMGRHAGFIAAASGLAGCHQDEPPHLILFPEQAFDSALFSSNVQSTVDRLGYCVVVASEGIKDAEGRYLSATTSSDAFGHTQLGGVAPILAHRLTQALGLKCHWAVSDYLQRAARHSASQTDVDQAYALGQQAVQWAVKGKTGIMLTIVRESSTPYRWTIGSAPLDQVANQETKLPAHFMDESGFGITQACRDYLLPLIQGEAYPPYKAGLPDYVRLKNQLVPKKLGATSP
jgi:ATP-dependent phosphofructokinase / diphosphate-dependent phosphofructokinase